MPIVIFVREKRFRVDQQDRAACATKNVMITDGMLCSSIEKKGKSKSSLWLKEGCVNEADGDGKLRNMTHDLSGCYS